MTLSEHVWGASSAADRVWAQVAGMAPSLIGRRYMVALRAFMDESEGEDGTFVLAGHIASVEAWAKFAVEWEDKLPLAYPRRKPEPQGSPSQRFRPIDELNPPKPERNAERFHFKMSQMASGGMSEWVPIFSGIIDDHAMYSLSCRVHVKELNSAVDRLHIPGWTLDFEEFRNPYYSAFFALMDRFHATREDMITPDVPELRDAKVDFYFDERSDKRLIRSAWDEYMETREPHARALYGNEPKFEKDEEFLPLQAADFWAWWIREWSEEGTLDERMSAMDFGAWKGKKRARSHIDMREHHWIQHLVRAMAPKLPLRTPIFDKSTNKVIGWGWGA